MPATRTPSRESANGEITIPVVNTTIPVIQVPVPVPPITTQTVALGALAGLVIVGVVEWPLAVLMGLGYAALSRRPARESS